MPTYEFQCEKCNKTFDVTMSVSEYDEKKVTCPKCGGNKLKRVISSFRTITSKKS
jgi:putative FmdB family regulatory protein